MNGRKHLLIVYHTQTGNTLKLAEAARRGAAQFADEVEVRFLTAFQAGLDDLLWCHGLLLGTPENFGCLSGGMKDFLDRTYYPAQGKVEGLPYAMFVSAGNDGTGAVAAMERIARGYALKKIHEPVIARQAVSPAHLAACEELGQALAGGLAFGVF